MEQPGQYRQFYIRKIITEVPGTRSFELAPADGFPVEYKPGQFLTFVFFKAGGEEVRRSYSISSAPSLDEPLRITVKRIANGEYSRWLIDKAKEGDTLLVAGVSGFFTLPTFMIPAKPIVFFAAGSGITPVYALIKTILYQHADVPVFLIYSNTAPETTIFYKELKLLESKFNARFRIHFLFSTSADLSAARLNAGFIERFLTQFSTEKNIVPGFYLCGPFDYMRMITIVLQGQGILPANIRKELFQVEKPARRPSPPDKEPHHITVQTKNDTRQFSTEYPVTILQAAKALGIALPYSCESGQCGACAATCIQGKVWMWHNDVLLDEEIANGRILTCTGYPVGGDVVLKYDA